MIVKRQFGDCRSSRKLSLPVTHVYIEARPVQNFKLDTRGGSLVEEGLGQLEFASTNGVAL